MNWQKKISLQGVKKKFLQNGKDIDIFSNLTIDFEKHTSYAIMGPSGCGKSTLLALLAGAEEVIQGDIIINGISIFRCTAEEKNFFLKHTMSIVLQKAYLIPELSILENVALRGIIANLCYREAFSEAEDLLEKMGLASSLNILPSFLSQGQQQRVAIARALISKPDFLLADEPTANLDKKTAEDIFAIMLSYQEKYGFGLIVATHDTILAQKMKRQLIIQENRLVDVSLPIDNRITAEKEYGES